MKNMHCVALAVLLTGCCNGKWEWKHKIPQVNAVGMHWADKSIGRYQEFVLVCDATGKVIGDIQPNADTWWAKTEGWPMLYAQYEDELSAASAVVEWSYYHHSCTGDQQ